MDDIIADVLIHSESVIKTINNESVLIAYLEKVVSTSMITVPKRLNFKQERSVIKLSIEETSVCIGELPVSTGATAIRTNYIMDKILGKL